MNANRLSARSRFGIGRRSGDITVEWNIKNQLNPEGMTL
jgi:hypothetical protein